MNKIDKEKLPNHVAIVPDGNRRWAKNKGLAPWRGHLAGAKKTEEQVQTAFDLGLKCLSWWGGSYNNLTKRAKIEINNLFRIYERYFKKLIKDKEIYKNEVKVSVIGRWQEILPKTGIYKRRKEKRNKNNGIYKEKKYDWDLVVILIGLIILMFLMKCYLLLVPIIITIAYWLYYNYLKKDKKEEI